MNRQASSAARFAGALLLAAALVAACGRGAGSAAPPTVASPAPTDLASTAPDRDAGPTLQGSPADGAIESDTPEPSETASTPSATYIAPNPADDPVTSELKSVDQLINNINGSISGSDAGGE